MGEAGSLGAKAGSFLVAEGPLRVKVSEGEALICGARCRKDYEFIVMAEKASTIEAVTDLKLEFYGGLGSKLEFRESTIPKEWFEVMEEVEKGARTVMLIGAVDSGKTFMTTYMANRLVDVGLKVAIVDCDVGQTTIGPPAAIGLAFMDRPRPSLNELKMEKGYFVGSTTPTGHLLPMVVGVKKLVDLALKKAERVLIDTTGMVFGGAARALKLYKAEAIKPDLAVFLEREGELDHLVRQFKALNIEVRSVPASKWVKARDRASRRMLREVAFQAHFKFRNTGEVDVDLNKVPILGSYLTSGAKSLELANEVEKLLGLKVHYCEKLPEGLLAIVEGRMELKHIELLKEKFGEVVKLLKKGLEKGLLVGLLDSEGLLLDVGVLKKLDMKSGKASIATPLKDLKDVKAIKIGSLRLGENYEEVERLEPGFI